MRSVKCGLYVIDITVHIKWRECVCSFIVLCADSVVFLMVHWYPALMLSKDSFCVSTTVLFYDLPSPPSFFFPFFFPSSSSSEDVTVL